MSRQCQLLAECDRPLAAAMLFTNALLQHGARFKSRHAESEQKTMNAKLEAERKICAALPLQMNVE